MRDQYDDIDQAVADTLLRWAKDDSVTVDKIEMIRKYLKDRGHRPLTLEGEKKANPQGPVAKLSGIQFDEAAGSEWCS